MAAKTTKRLVTSKLIRVQLLLTERQRTWLRERAVELGISVSDVVRRIMDGYVDNGSSTQGGAK